MRRFDTVCPELLRFDTGRFDTGSWVRPLPRLGGLAAALAVTLAAMVAPPVAHARQSDEHTYAYDQVWRAAVRLVAVDFRFPITDRDPEIGYLLFQYMDQGRAHEGSFEIVRTRAADGSERVRVVIQIGTMPGYVERMMLDRFRRKLMDDYGAPPVIRPAPPRPAPAPPPEPPADGDAPPSSSSGALRIQHGARTRPSGHDALRRGLC